MADPLLNFLILADHPELSILGAVLMVLLSVYLSALMVRRVQHRQTLRTVTPTVCVHCVRLQTLTTSVMRAELCKIAMADPTFEHPCGRIPSCSSVSHGVHGPHHALRCPCSTQ